MRNERKILYISFAISLIIHILMLAAIVPRTKEEKKIVWVSVRMPQSTLEPRIDKVSAPPQSKAQTTESKEHKETKEQRKARESKISEKELVHERGQGKKLNQKELNQKRERENLNKGKEKGKLSKGLQKTPKLTEKVQPHQGRSSQANSPKSAQSRSPGTGSPKTEKLHSEFSEGEIEAKLTSIINEYLEDSEGENSAEIENNIKVLYAMLIREIVQKNFEIPPSLRAKELLTTVYVKIDRNGNIAEAKIKESSGDQNFDLFVMKAVRDSSPFPAPPADIELIIRFSNE